MILNSFKGFFYYMIIILVMTVLLNGLVFPSALKSQVKEVGYNEFLTMVDNGQVAQVEKMTRTARSYSSQKTAMGNSRSTRQVSGMIRI